MPALSHSLATYRTIRDRIVAAVGDLDEETLRDTLEGETDLHEVVASVVRAAKTDEALAEGLRGYLKDLRERLDGLKERARRKREMARNAMVQADLETIRAPDFTLSVRAGAPALVVVDEEAIPEEYWVSQSPKLDRQGLLSDMKRGRAVAGVALSNPEPVLNVRVR